MSVNVSMSLNTYTPLKFGEEVYQAISFSFLIRTKRLNYQTFNQPNYL